MRVIILSLFFTVLCLIFNYSSVFGQTTLISTIDFGSGTSLPANWTASGAQSSNISVNVSSISNGYTLPSGTVASGSSNVTDGYPSSTIGTSVLTVTNINASGKSNIKVTYGARKTSSYTGTITFEWSSDGVTWNLLTITDVSNNSTWKAINGGIAILLPASANNQANLRFRWTFVRTTTSGNYRIDDFNVYTGTLLTPTFTELVVPKFIAGNQPLVVNNSRTSFAFCFQLDNLTPNKAYNLRAGLNPSSDLANATTLGLLGGTTANPTGYIVASSNYIASCFTTNANGSSGPVWIFLQSSGNAKFNPGNTDLRLRIYYSTTTAFSATYNFQTNAAITTLDAGMTTIYSASSTDDGAYVKLSSSSDFSGKYALLFDNTAGIGSPLFAYQFRNSTLTQASQSELPANINDIYLQSGTSASGDAPVIIPIGANNPNGIKRIEVRNSDNSIYAYFTKASGIWDDNATTQNTTTILRAAVQTISLLKGVFDYAAIYGSFSQTGDVTINDTLDIAASNALTIGSNKLILNGVVLSSTGTLTGSGTSNLTIGGTSGISAGTLNFTTGAASLNTLSMSRTGVVNGPAAVMGNSLDVNAFSFTNGILATGNNLLTWNNSGGALTAPNIPWVANNKTYKDSYICLCTSTGNTLTFSQPYTGTVGFKIKNIGGTNTDTWFPVGLDFKSPNRMVINNANGTAQDFTVALQKGDITNTPLPTGKRIWYVSASDETNAKASMQLYYTKQVTTDYGVKQDEIESGFLYSDGHLVQETYPSPYTPADQFVSNSLYGSSDIEDFISGSSYDTSSEIRAMYTYGVSKDLSNNTNGIKLFTRFSITNANTIILPVTLIGLTATLVESKVNVSWTSLNELNIDHYSIERSSTANTFITIGTMKATVGTSSAKDYAFNDEVPLQGNNFYRIKAMDKDGRIIYSNIVSLAVNTGTPGISIIPNPVKNYNVILSFTSIPAGKYNITLFSTTGNTVFKQVILHNSISAGYSLSLPSSLAKGVYFISIQSNTVIHTQKLIIQ